MYPVNTDKVLQTVKAIQDGSPAKPLLEELSLNDLTWLATTVLQGTPPQNRRDMIADIIALFDTLESLRPTSFQSPGNSAEFEKKAFAWAERGRERKARLPDCTLPDEYADFLAPYQHAIRMGIYKYDGAVDRINFLLGELLLRATKNPDELITIDDVAHPIGKLVTYANKPRSGAYTHYSSPLLTSYLVEKLHYFPLKPENSDLVNSKRFCADHLHVDNLTYAKRIRELVYKVLADKTQYPDFPESDKPLVAIYRVSNGGSPHVYFSRLTVPWFEKQLGLFPYSEKKPEKMKSIGDMLVSMKLQTNKRVREDFDGFLTKELLTNPNRIINTDTQHTLRDAVAGYRLSTGNSALYLKDELEDFLRKEWLEQCPQGAEKADWCTGRALLCELGLYKRETEKETNAAMQEVLADIRREQHDQVKCIKGKNLPVSQLIRRYTHSGWGAAYYIHKDALALPIITAEMVHAKVEERRKHEVNAGYELGI